jgi:hypothetical protein
MKNNGTITSNNISNSDILNKIIPQFYTIIDDARITNKIKR